MKQTIPCALTLEEQAERTKRLTHLDIKLALVEGEREAFLRQSAKTARDIRIERSRLITALRTGSETREVECRTEVHEPTGTMRTLRCDTGELVDERPLDASERQLPMFTDLAEPDGAPSKPAKPQKSRETAKR